MQSKTTNIPCKRCGGKTGTRGYEIFAIAPHKRRKVSCKTCGHTFVPKEEIIIEGEVQDVDEAGN